MRSAGTVHTLAARSTSSHRVLVFPGTRRRFAHLPDDGRLIIVTLATGTCSTNTRITDAVVSINQRMDDGFENMNRRIDDTNKRIASTTAARSASASCPPSSALSLGLGRALGVAGHRHVSSGAHVRGEGLQALAHHSPCHGIVKSDTSFRCRLFGSNSR